VKDQHGPKLWGQTLEQVIEVTQRNALGDEGRRERRIRAGLLDGLETDRIGPTNRASPSVCCDAAGYGEQIRALVSGFNGFGFARCDEEYLLNGVIRIHGREAAFTDEGSNFGEVSLEEPAEAFALRAAEGGGWGSGLRGGVRVSGELHGEQVHGVSAAGAH
jgi:hypothetical protein